MADQRAVELAALCTRIAQLEAAHPADPCPEAAVCPPVLPILFADLEAVDKVKAAAIAAKGDNKKTPLPEIVPGFKANSLDVREYILMIPSLSFTGVKLLEAKGPFSSSNPVH
jgi:hypothetical protein